MEFEKLKLEVDKVKGSTFVSLDTTTEVKLSGGKKNPFQGRVKKITSGANVMIFSGTAQNGYENMVKRRMLEEGKDPDTFVLGKRAWGTRIGETPFIEHNGKHYLECVFISPGKSKYLVDGIETPKEEIEGIPEAKENTESQGGIENKVVIRSFALDSISSVRMKGVELV